jgi:hypothetical protein
MTLHNSPTVASLTIPSTCEPSLLDGDRATAIAFRPHRVAAVGGPAVQIAPLPRGMHRICGGYTVGDFVHGAHRPSGHRVLHPLHAAPLLSTGRVHQRGRSTVQARSVLIAGSLLGFNAPALLTVTRRVKLPARSSEHPHIRTSGSLPRTLRTRRGCSEDRDGRPASSVPAERDTSLSNWTSKRKDRDGLTGLGRHRTGRRRVNALFLGLAAVPHKKRLTRSNPDEPKDAA